MALYWANQSTGIHTGDWFGRQWMYDVASRYVVLGDANYTAYLNVYIPHPAQINLPWATAMLEALVYVYAIDNRASFDSIVPSWLPVTNGLTPTRPVFLVGMKKDLRDKAEMGEADPGATGTFLSTEEGMNLAAQIHAEFFAELNVSDLQGLNDFWTPVINATFQGPNYKKIRATARSSGCCVLL